MTALSIILIILIIIAVLAIWQFNVLVKLRNAVDNAWAQIEVQLQRRLDLIPNLVETVKGYATHESGTLEAVTAARAACMGTKSWDEMLGAQNKLSETLKSLFAVSENYPELRASESFTKLQAQLEDTEDKISYMRQSFNDTVMKYNTAIQTFPGVLVAGPMGFRKRTSYNADLGAEVAPVVDFTGSGNEAR